jgi:hypothetical protein
MEEIKIISILVLIPIFMACATVVGVGSITKTSEEFKEYFKKYTPIMIVFYFIILIAIKLISRLVKFLNKKKLLKLKLHIQLVEI